MPQLYAIAGTIERARFFLGAGAPVVQLRFKTTALAPHLEEIRSWSRQYPACRLVINDDLDFAEAAGAWGAHLGQEDLQRFSPERVAKSGLQVGISTHNNDEIAFALGYRPALLGFGPIYATATKQTGHAPQGVDRLREVVRTAGLPIVAIGGIGETNFEEVAATECAYAAMISSLDRCQTVEDVRAVMLRLGGGR